MNALKALIPLDGTRLSESAFSVLPLLRDLGFGEVRLIGVWQRPWQGESLGSRRDSELEEANGRGRAYVQAYLESQVKRLDAFSLDVHIEARSGNPAEELLDAAGDSDLIVIATHGRDGVARFRLGSVADKVVRNAACPTLVIGPNVRAELRPFALRRLLVPLDGSDLAEVAIAPAVWLARAADAEIDLVRVVSMVVSEYPFSYTMDIYREIEDAGREYLDQVAKAVGPGVKLRTKVLGGAAADKLIDYMQTVPYDLVVMASHGRSGVLRATLGSVADRLLHGPAPVLILRPEQSSGRFMEAALRAAGTERETQTT